MYKRAYAVIVGIGDYKRASKLSYSPKDAEEVYRLLTEECGYVCRNIRVLLDAEANKKNILRCLDWLAEKSTSNQERETICLFYYSGHGFEVGSTSYLYTSDTVFNSLEQTSISDSELGDQIAKIKGKLAVLFDSCRSGGFHGKAHRAKSASTLSVSGWSQDNIGKLVGVEDAVILASSRLDQDSWEDPNLGQGVFTYYLLQGVRNKKNWKNDRIDVLDLFKNVRDNIDRYFQKKGSPLKQNPVFTGKISSLTIGLRDHSRTRRQIKFANREQELDWICPRHGPEFEYIIIDGPAGYGKSRLLDEVVKRYSAKNKSPQKRICVKMDLGDCPYRSEERYQDHIIFYIVRALEQELKLKKSFIDNWDKVRLQEKISYLAGVINKKKIRLLLIFDTVELNVEAMRWIAQKRGLLHELRNRLIEKNNIRIIFAGRNVRRNFEFDWPDETFQLTLSEFEKKIIMRVIAETETDPVRREGLSRETMFLSGGHPGIIETIVMALRHNGHAVKLNGPYLDQDDLDILFRNCAEDMDDVLNNVFTSDDELDEVRMDDLSEALKVLCILKRFDKDILSAFQMLYQESGLPYSLSSLSKFPTLTDMLRKLINLGFIRKLRRGYEDGLTCRLLLHKMRFQNPSLFKILNSLAYETYNELVLASPCISEREVDYLIERLYHFVCMADHGGSVKEELSRIKALISDPTGYYVERFLDSLWLDDASMYMLGRNLMMSEVEIVRWVMNELAVEKDSAMPRSSKQAQ